MGALKYSKSDKVFLRDANLDEKWLQTVIADDPSILGLGDLTLIERERIQPRGRLDLLLADFNSSVRYVTEVQLGTLDESHIIRTIEYWDIERKRFPNKEHVAVIIAEDITSRFLNVLSLFNNNLPVIALQLDCRSFEGNLFLNFIRVLDHVEPLDEDEAEAIKTDRTYWTSKSNPDSIKLLDKISKELSLIDGESSLTYNKHHVAYGGSGRRNYVWFNPRKSKFLNFTLRFREEDTEKVKDTAEQIGLQVLNPRKTKLSFNIKPNELSENIETIRNFLKTAYKSSI